MANEPDIRRLTVEDAEGARLDTYIPVHMPDLSRTRTAQLLADGQVLVNGAIAKKSYRPVAGDAIEVRVPPAVESGIDPEAIPLTIVHEDADLLVIDKPAGLVVHPAPGHHRGTLVHALLHHIGDLSGIGGVLRPGIVHRLDRDTSGLMLVAKTDAAHRELSAALKRREVSRIYHAAAWGHLAQDSIEVDAPIGRSRNDRRRMAVVADGRPARTRFQRLARWPAADLIRAELETGRTHQIRVHLAHLGHPVVGDATYGPNATRGMGGATRAWAHDFDRRVPRQFLHAAELSFRHPITGEAMRFVAVLPPDLAAAAAWADSTSTAG